MWQLFDIFPNNGGLLGYILQQTRWIGGVVTLDVTPCVKKAGSSHKKYLYIWNKNSAAQ